MHLRVERGELGLIKCLVEEQDDDAAEDGFVSYADIQQLLDE